MPNKLAGKLDELLKADSRRPETVAMPVETDVIVPTSSGDQLRYGMPHVARCSCVEGQVDVGE